MFQVAGAQSYEFISTQAKLINMIQDERHCVNAWDVVITVLMHFIIFKLCILLSRLFVRHSLHYI